MFGLEILNLSPETAFTLGVLFGMLLMWAIEDDLGTHSKEARA